MPTLVPQDRYMSVKQFADSQKMCVSSIYHALNNDRLSGHKVGKTWLIPYNALISGRRIRDGRLIGITELKNNNINGFLKKRGY
jgi:hypothetical protein